LKGEAGITNSLAHEKGGEKPENSRKKGGTRPRGWYPGPSNGIDMRKKELDKVDKGEERGRHKVDEKGGPRCKIRNKRVRLWGGRNLKERKRGRASREREGP